MTKGEKAKQTILAAAVQLISECGGTEKVSLRDIAERADIPVSRILYHFQNRAALLNGVVNFCDRRTQVSPISDFLCENEELLESREGQSFFINDLFSYLRELFRRTPERALGCARALRLVLQSPECPVSNVTKVPDIEGQDLASFCSIYKRITGSEDFELACFWFDTTLRVLIQRLSGAKPLAELNSNHPFSKDYDIRFLYFCRKRLLIGLNLWDAPLESRPIPSEGEEK